MALEKIQNITGRAIHIPGDDVDTDRITPARYLKVITFDTLGEALFYDERFNSDGTEKNHPLNDPRFIGSSIMLVGSNFGCGSSREHSPQAIYRAGFRAVIGESFAEIFFSNSTNLSIPCVKANKSDITALAAAVEQNPSLEIALDLLNLEVRYAGHGLHVERFKVEIAASAQSSLTNGRWDPIADLLEAGDLLEVFDARLARVGV